MAVRTLTCVVCSEPFEASRSDAKTCSRACRSRRFREGERRRDAALRAEVERATALLGALADAASMTPGD